MRLVADSPAHRLNDYVRRWRVDVGERIETDSSCIAFGRRGGRDVVLKVLKHAGDEWHSGATLGAFDGRGAVRVFEHAPGALILERASPGKALVALSLEGRDDEATDILAGVIAAMSPRTIPGAAPRVQDWGASFQGYPSSRTAAGIPEALVAEARRTFHELCRSQRQPRLLHGDLHHYNVLYDRSRGWLAVDPKGVVGEIECEIGAALRNPVERPELFDSAATVARRLERFASKLAVDAERALRWAFAQAVLAAIWRVEDGLEPDPRHPFIRLAEAVRPMVVT